MIKKGKLHFFCGKMAAGKSTLAIKIKNENNSILISEDVWLSQIYPDEIKEFEHYLKYSSRLKKVLKKHIQELLSNGTSVVLDFPANTKSQRKWFKEIFSEIDAPYCLHYIEASDALCKKQLLKRSKDKPIGTPFTTEREFDEVNMYFEPPSNYEGFNVTICKK